MFKDTRFPPRTKALPVLQGTPEFENSGKLAILSVLRESNLFGIEDVEKLYSGLLHYTSRHFKFYCLTDSTKTISNGITKISLNYTNRPTKYSKLELFRSDVLELADNFFYFDLDTVIIDNINDVLSYSGMFAMLSDFYRPNDYGSGLMAWSKDIGSHLYDDFVKMSDAQLFSDYPIGGGRGDQSFIQQHCEVVPHFLQEMVPDQIVSYKIHCKGRPKPPNTRIVCFHGRPKLSEIKDDWIIKKWKR